MSIARPSTLILDALVSGDADEELDAWAWLVAAPDAAEAFDAAWARRKRLEEESSLLLSWPQLAEAIYRIRKMKTTPTPFLFRVERSLIEATLDSDRFRVPSTVRSGAYRFLRLTHGTRARFDGDRCWALLPSGKVFPDEQGWKLESGDAPVALFAFRGVQGAKTLGEAFDKASHAAALVLLDDDGGGETP